jgi:hypothetical protein
VHFYTKADDCYIEFSGITALPVSHAPKNFLHTTCVTVGTTGAYPQRSTSMQRKIKQGSIHGADI